LKFGLSLAVLALIGDVSATQLVARLNEKPSDEVANGDEAENKEIEDEGDDEDGIVDDDGFVNQWKDQHEFTEVMTRARLNEKPSDEVANGDESENK